MDNIVQNINIEDIVPSIFQNQSDNSKELQDLAISIKNHGMIEPLLVRPKNGKYEIILGNKRYKAAKMIGLSSVLALVKDIDDDVFNEYMRINNIQHNPPHSNKFINPSPNNDKLKSENPVSKQSESQNKLGSNTLPSQNTFDISNLSGKSTNYIKNNNTDIVNLAELNRKEYERDDLKMNNNLMNNNNIGSSQPMNATSVQEPTFGGRFFPSLEDEPTNMNMGGIPPIQPAIANPQPSQNNQQPVGNTANNLIDLTDIAAEKEPQAKNPTNFTAPEISQSVPEFMQNNINANPQTSIMNSTLQSNELVNPIPNPTDTVVNLGNLQNNNDFNNSMNMQSQPNVGVLPQNNMPEVGQTIAPPQFDMSQNIAPTEFVQNQNLNPTMSMPQSTISTNPVQIPSYDIQETPTVPTPVSNIPNINQNIPSISQEPLEEVAMMPQKEVQPVLNTLKNVATSLEAFGYKINIIEEDLPTSAKITIEVIK